MSLAYHCDLDSCDSWQRLDSDLPSEWVVLAPAQYRDDEFGVFCTLDCAGRWAIAHSEPTETLVEL